MRVLIALLLVAALLPVAAPAEAAEELYPMVFPVDGEHRYSDTWGACRGSGCSRGHEGTDILANKMVPVVAVADGTVRWIRNTVGEDCCYMALTHDDGWESWYIHLNNDTPGTDDGQGYGFAEGIDWGVHVEAGQLIGWVGDSGNAESTIPHLHFELHMPDGTKVNPYPHLVFSQETFEGTFRDDDGSSHEVSIEWAAGQGITLGCDARLSLYCPETPVTRGQMAAFLVRALGLTEGLDDPFADDDGHLFEGDIEKLAAAGITMGCDAASRSYCPNDTVTRGQMAAFLARALDLPAAEGNDFADAADHHFAREIGQLAAAGVTFGCNPPDNDRYCPNQVITRDQMATFLYRALADA